MVECWLVTPRDAGSTPVSSGFFKPSNQGEIE
jgi:hypothetical protein